MGDRRGVLGRGFANQQRERKRELPRFYNLVRKERSPTYPLSRSDKRKGR